jgi:hypothetical protein
MITKKQNDMKKNYFKLMTLSLGLVATSFAGFAQTDAQLSTTTFSVEEISSILKGVHKNINPTNKDGQSVCTNVLPTPMAGGNSFDGNMFDIVATNAVTIETFAVTTDSACTVEIYARTGTYVGFEQASAGWTLVGTGAVAAGGVGIPVEVPVDIAYPMAQGSTHAFYITANVTQVAVWNYTNGTVVGDSWASDANIDVKEGAGGEYPFGQTFAPRNFNGQVIYCIPSTGVNEVLSGANVSVFPNPANNELNISLPANGNTTNVSIFNVIGEVVFTENIIANGTTTNFDISTLKSGVYIVKLVSEGSEYSTKLFVD